VVIPYARSPARDHHVSDETVLADEAMDFLAVAFITSDDFSELTLGHIRGIESLCYGGCE
jgi:hypothetical protein